MRREGKDLEDEWLQMVIVFTKAQVGEERRMSTGIWSSGERSELRGVDPKVFIIPGTIEIAHRYHKIQIRPWVWGRSLAAKEIEEACSEK